MEAATVAATDGLIEHTEAEAILPEPAATVPARKLFKYSDYVHVGEGAVECEHALDGQCEDIEHFHAWCRLPNPFQHEDIRKKALAAKARKIRELRDPESDASVTLDNDLGDIEDPIFVQTLIDELLARNWAEDYIEAQTDVEEREEFEHVVQDREEFNRLKDSQENLPEDEQSEEYKQLYTHMSTYVAALRERMNEIQEPKRQEMSAQPKEEIVEQVRTKRIEEQGDQTFLDAYNAWMWFVGTFKVELHPTLRRPHLPMWEDIGTADRPAAGTMRGAEPEVIDALKLAFNSLQLAQQQGSAGN